MTTNITSKKNNKINFLKILENIHLPISVFVASLGLDLSAEAIRRCLFSSNWLSIDGSRSASPTFFESASPSDILD